MSIIESQKAPEPVGPYPHARKVGNLLSISTRHMACVGDSYNDLPMFRECGLSISMGGAPKSVEEEADFVVPPVTDDGLVEAIKDIILPRLEIGD